MKSSDLLKLIFNKPFRFWSCSNKNHNRVTWNKSGTQATCDECGDKSSPSKIS
jgi:ribosomal protein S27E